MSSPSGEILTIGTEILLGEIVDTNSAYIAQALRQQGLNLYGTATVGDNISRISQAFARALERADFVISTGGLGPTVDDMTREAVAEMAGMELLFKDELWDQVKARFARYGSEPGENNRRQAHLPGGAVGIENPIGTAPAFQLELEQGIIYALPGVPAEMKWLLHERVIPDIASRFPQDQVIERRLLRTAGVGESTLDAEIQDLEQSENPTLGLAAHPGQVDLRLTATAESKAEADALLDEMEAELRRRVGRYIYGLEDDSLESVVLTMLKERNWDLVTVEAGTGGALAGSLEAHGHPFLRGLILNADQTSHHDDILAAEMTELQACVGLSLVVRQEEDQVQLGASIHTPEGEDRWGQSYGGPPENASAWGAALLLERLRQRMI